MEDIQQMIDKHEAFKSKWLKMNEQDIFDWICLQDEMEAKAIELTSKYLLEKEAIENEYDFRFLEMKAKVWDDWKKLYTDKVAESMVAPEFQKRKEDQILLKATIDALRSKASKIEPLTNAVKIFMKKDFSI